MKLNLLAINLAKFIICLPSTPVIASSPIIKIGFLAQDIQKVFPELVSISKNKMLAVNYQGLVPVLINSVNELSVKNSNLKSRIKKLRKLISEK